MKNTFIFAFFVFSLGLFGAGSPEGLVQAQGTKLLLEGEEFIIRGMAFGNQIWLNPSDPDQIIHHGPEDYHRISALGFNAVRFYLGEALFSTPKVYDWIDQNIAWARDAGIRIILNMHVPPGGYQSNGEGDELWRDPANARKLALIWRDLAQRYRNEPVILGYGIVNEPVPVGSSKAWEDMAKMLVREIRRVDPYHLIFIEKALWVNHPEGRRFPPMEELFPDFSDPGPGENLVLEFHFYDPMNFTHQGASWISDLVDVRTSYPDPEPLWIQGEKWVGASFESPQIRSKQGWQDVISPVFTIKEKSWKHGRLALQFFALGDKGEAMVRDLSLEKVVDGQSIPLWPLDSELPQIHWIWQEEGEGGGAEVMEIPAFTGRSGLRLWGSEKDANVSLAKVFPLTFGEGYRIRGQVLMEEAPQDSFIRLRLDYYDHDVVHQGWNKELLEKLLEPFMELGRIRNKPLYLGEFGVISHGFDQGRGGEKWVEDLLELLVEKGISYTYHTYHEPAFGLYTTWGELPREAEKNLLLEQVFLRIKRKHFSKTWEN